MSAHVLFIGGEDHFMRIPFFKAMQRLGFRVTAAASGDAKPFADAGIDYRSFSFARFVNPAADVRAVPVIARLLSAVGADVAHCFDTKLGLLVPYAARAQAKTAIVRTINGRGWVYSSRSPGAMAIRAIYRPLHRLAAASTRATVFEHHGDESFFVRNRLVGAGEAIVIPGAGLDIDGFERARAAGPAPDALRRELGLEGKEVVITVTRVTRAKGIPTLLAAAALVHRERPHARFLLVGPRESEGGDVTAAEIDKHRDYVIATGSRSDVPSLLGMADLFAFPSEYAEGIPRAIMEAALCGLPIVSTELSGCREVIRDGWNGRLTPLHDPRAFADAVLAMLDDRDEARRMGARGPQIVRERFGLDDIVAQHAALYQRIVAQARS